jgi:hypothetical protein
MRVLSYLHILMHRLNQDDSGKFASEYLQFVAYIALATFFGMLNILSDIRRALVGESIG